MRKLGWLFLWIMLIIFPIMVLENISPLFRKVLNTLFAPEWVHVISHLLLFTGLGVLLMVTFRLPLSPRTGMVILVVALGVGLLQEIFQVITQGLRSPGGIVVDLGLDLAGGLAGMMIMGWKRRNPRRTERPDS